MYIQAYISIYTVYIKCVHSFLLTIRLLAVYMRIYLYIQYKVYPDIQIHIVYTVYCMQHVLERIYIVYSALAYKFYINKFIGNGLFYFT